MDVRIKGLYTNQEVTFRAYGGSDGDDGIARLIVGMGEGNNTTTLGRLSSEQMVELRNLLNDLLHGK